MMRPDTDRSADATLLSTVTNVLGLLAHPKFPESYCARVHRRFAWCSEIARTLVPVVGSAASSPRSSTMFASSAGHVDFMSPTINGGQFSPVESLMRSNSFEFSSYNPQIPEASFDSPTGSRGSGGGGGGVAFASGPPGFDPVLSAGASSGSFSPEATLDFGLSSRNSTAGAITPEDGTSFADSFGQSAGVTPMAAQMDTSHFANGFSTSIPMSLELKDAFDFDGRDGMGDPLFDDTMVYEN